MIFFRSGSPALGLDEAERLLTERGLRVLRHGDALHVRRQDGPELRIAFSAEPHVAAEAAELAADSPLADAMGRCDARFEILIEDLEPVLDEINTLIEVQATLQDATGGYLYNSWNGEWSGPEKPT